MLQIVACFCVVSTKAAQVLHKNTLDLSLCRFLHHGVPLWAVKQCTCHTIIRIGADQLDLRMLIHIRLDDALLVFNGCGILILDRQAAVSSSKYIFALDLIQVFLYFLLLIREFLSPVAHYFCPPTHSLYSSLPLPGKFCMVNFERNISGSTSR